jgi:hypothetical protein
MDKLKIYNFYKGCINSGNIGDDVLFYILIYFYKYVIENKFNIKNVCINNNLKSFDIINNDLNIKDIVNYINDDNCIFIIGGGSIIHPLEISYTRFYLNNEKHSLFINGTGITCCNKSNINENNINNILINNDFSKNLFDDTFLKLNFETIQNFNNVYGGFRGIYEKSLYNHNTNKNLDYINDIGLFTDLIPINNNNINIENNNKKIILISSAYLGGSDAFKDVNMSYSEYNLYIENILVEFSIYLINNGYFIYLYFLGDNTEIYYYNKIIDKIDKNYIKYIDYFKEQKKIENLIDILKKCYIVIGVRLHSNIISNGLLIPSIHIAYGVKALNYVSTNELMEYCIPTFTNTLTFENLLNKFNLIVLNYDNIVEKLKFNKNKYFNKYFNNICDMLSKYIHNDYNKCEISYISEYPQKKIDSIFTINLN